MDAYFALKKAFYTLEMKQAKDIFVMFNSSCIRITYYLYVIHHKIFTCTRYIDLSTYKDETKTIVWNKFYLKISLLTT